MENVGAEFLGDIWENGQQNENFEIEIDEYDERERDENGTLDGGVASEDAGDKRRSTECEMVSRYVSHSRDSTWWKYSPSAVCFSFYSSLAMKFSMLPRITLFSAQV